MNLKLSEWLNTNLNPLIAKFTGFRIVKDFPIFDEVRNNLVKKLNISIAIDGGANHGQWASRFRSKNHEIKIFSFEPISSVFENLSAKVGADKNWIAFNFALGEKESTAEINVSNNDGMSSSLRKPSNHLDVYPSVIFGKSEKITIKRLDSFEYGEEDELILLKLDVQGFEIDALKGAENLFDRVAMIEIETSYRQMYEGEMNHTALVAWLENRGFEVFTISQPTFERNGRVGYLDCLLVKADLLEKYLV